MASRAWTDDDHAELTSSISEVTPVGEEKGANTLEATVVYAISSGEDSEDQAHEQGAATARQGKGWN